ncbi:restriction endonuclease subunit S [Catenibacterium mitsuokai]|uniref:restriction endonuclease subunit S n=1 Tax=Catenibacterium mitsuokai TaxID=100886 RepID=UPI0022E493F7|nr:restriction endonuclease subunit S [Catenibacterium mitsuokai]
MEKSRKPKIRFRGYTDDWEQRKLGEVATFINGRAYSQSELLPSGKYKILRVGNFYTNDSWYYSDLELGEKYYANYGDLLYTWSATFGPHIWLGDRVIYHYHIWKISLSGMLEKQFAVQLLEQHKSNILSGKNGSTMVHITKEGMEQKDVIIPQSIKEQQQIGTFFNRIDYLITLHQRKLDKLINVKKSMLEKMFPKQGSTVPEIRFTGFTNDWEQRKLGEVMNVTSVKRIHQSDWTDYGIRFLRARDIVSAYKNEEPDDYLYISKEKYDEYSSISGKVSIGDMLVTGVGTIGVPYLVENSEPLYFKDGNIIWFQNEDKVFGKFLFYSFAGKSIQDFITESAGIGTVGTYTIESGKKTPISLPNKEEQERIGLFFANLDHLITLHQCELEKLQNIKKSMLEKMFV